MSFPSKKAAAEQLSFISPAKINLFFRVIHKRKDGFHEIASLYQAISLHDTLHVSLSKKDLFTCSLPFLAMDEKNLVCQALALFRKKTGIDHPLQIHLEKNIPIEAGLGGGSSNAATALWSFSQIFSCDMSQKELEELGSQIGSDVPFFFSSGTSYCTGRGDVLTEACVLDPVCIWIAKPSMGLSTPLVYKSCNLDLLLPRDPKESLASFLSEKSPLFYNDLEGAAFLLCPFLEEFKKNLLKSGFEHVVMSGSGTSFFCIGSNLPPKMENVKFYKVKFLRKEKLRWYGL